MKIQKNKPVKKTRIPTCKCHAEPMGWHKDNKLPAGGRWRCKVYFRNKLRKWREENREASREYDREWGKKNPDKRYNKQRRVHLKKYGLTEKKFAELLEKQNGVCAICYSTDEYARLKQPLAIDHCHATGTVRGLLCGNCNRAIGLFKNDPELLANALYYLQGLKPIGTETPVEMEKRKGVKK